MMSVQPQPVPHQRTAASKRKTFAHFHKWKYYYVLLLPGIIYFIVFKYVPMAGAVIAFKDFKVSQGIWGSEWAGLKWFEMLFERDDFWLTLSNTIIISFYKIIFSFPAPVVLAILLNEIRSAAFKRTIQTIIYFPHFVSWIVIGGILITILSPNSSLMQFFGFTKSPLMEPEYFRSTLVLSQIWKETGWGTVIYLAAIVGIDPSLYEAAKMDGANRFRQIIHITLPGIASTIVVLLILRMGYVLQAGFDQVYILLTPLVYSVGDILDTYVYRLAFTSGRFSLAAAAGLFQSVVGLIMIVFTNWVMKRMGQNGLW
ncbi:MAG: carbohydrate transporter rane protein 1, family [Paenibacillus sp.]|jgi:putative aldouronate transport system permease protein|nr:carbohydrate transporter rane protein 1, family [Paenibacillus sp.]